MYNYYYNGTPIPKQNFIKAVPENWENEIVNGVYTYGYYKAVSRETE